MTFPSRKLPAVNASISLIKCGQGLVLMPASCHGVTVQMSSIMRAHMGKKDSKGLLSGASHSWYVKSCLAGMTTPGSTGSGDGPGGASSGAGSRPRQRALLRGGLLQALLASRRCAAAAQHRSTLSSRTPSRKRPETALQSDKGYPGRWAPSGPHTSKGFFC